MTLLMKAFSFYFTSKLKIFQYPCTEDDSLYDGNDTEEKEKDFNEDEDNKVTEDWKPFVDDMKVLSCGFKNIHVPKCCKDGSVIDGR